MVCSRNDKTFIQGMLPGSNKFSKLGSMKEEKKIYLYN